MIGKTLGNYEITGLLGRGGMGEVYLARVYVETGRVEEAAAWRKGDSPQY